MSDERRSLVLAGVESAATTATGPYTHFIATKYIIEALFVVSDEICTAIRELQESRR